MTVNVMFGGVTLSQGPQQSTKPQKSQQRNFLDRLKTCVRQIYDVDLTGFTAANADTLGKFSGTGYDRYARRNGSISILTNATSFSGAQLATMNNDYARRYPDKQQPRVRPGDVVGGATFSFGTAGCYKFPHMLITWPMISIKPRGA
jgi:hypothetical protein